MPSIVKMWQNIIMHIKIVDGKTWNIHLISTKLCKNITVREVELRDHLWEKINVTDKFFVVFIYYQFFFFFLISKKYEIFIKTSVCLKKVGIFFNLNILYNAKIHAVVYLYRLCVMKTFLLYFHFFFINIMVFNIYAICTLGCIETGIF